MCERCQQVGVVEREIVIEQSKAPVVMLIPVYECPSGIQEELINLKMPHYIPCRNYRRGRGLPALGAKLKGLDGYDGGDQIQAGSGQ